MLVTRIATVGLFFVFAAESVQWSFAEEQGKSASPPALAMTPKYSGTGGLIRKTVRGRVARSDFGKVGGGRHGCGNAGSDGFGVVRNE